MRNLMYEHMDHFVLAAKDGDLLSESTFISGDIAHALDETRSFRRKQRSISGSVLLLELEWLGDGTVLEDLSRDFFRFYAEFAEESQFVRRTIEEHAVLFEVVSGNTSDCPHIHLFQIRMVGDQVSRMLEEYGRQNGGAKQGRS